MFVAGYPWLSGLRHVKHPPMSPFEAHYAPQVDGRAGSGETAMKRIHPGHPIHPGRNGNSQLVIAAKRRTSQTALPRRSCGQTPGSKSNPGPGTCVLTISASHVEQQAASANTCSPGKPEFELASSSHKFGRIPAFPAHCNCHFFSCRLQLPLSFPAPQKTFAISDTT